MSKVKFFRAKRAKAPAHSPEPHICEECGGMASFGFGGRSRLGQPVRWYCGKHKHLGKQSEQRSAA